MRNEFKRKMKAGLPIQFQIERVRDYLRGAFNIGPEIGLKKYRKIVLEQLRLRMRLNAR